MIIAAVAVLVGVFYAATGRGGELAYEQADHAPLDLGSVSAADVAILRPPTALWGYNMQVTDEALERIARAMRDRDVTIAYLRQQLTGQGRGTAPGSETPLPPSTAPQFSLASQTVQGLEFPEASQAAQGLDFPEASQAAQGLDFPEASQAAQGLDFPKAAQTAPAPEFPLPSQSIPASQGLPSAARPGAAVRPQARPSSRALELPGTAQLTGTRPGRARPG